MYYQSDEYYELKYAIVSNKPDTVKALLAPLSRTQKVDRLKQKDSNGQTALIWAAVQGHNATVEALLATPGLTDTDRVDLLKQKDQKGKTALMWASNVGHNAAVKAILATPGLTNKNKVELLKQEDRQKRTASIFASIGEQAATESFLNATFNKAQAALLLYKAALLLAFIAGGALAAVATMMLTPLSLPLIAVVSTVAAVASTLLVGASIQIVTSLKAKPASGSSGRSPDTSRPNTEMTGAPPALTPAPPASASPVNRRGY